MCFGGGGGGGGGTIVMPDTGAYDRMAQQQMDAMRSVQEGAVKLKQQELSAALQQKQDVLTSIRDLKQQQADSSQAVEAQAQRLAALIGPPPPEETAQAPVVGASRENTSKAKGKSALRISRPTATTMSKGAGLNIT